MKTAGIISAFLSFIIIISSLASCANPVGESSTHTTSPPPADAEATKTPETTVGETAKQIDLSGLTKEELAKFKGDLTEKLKDDSVGEIKVNIFLKKSLTEKELDSKIEEQIIINEKKYSELGSELEELYKQKKELEASSRATSETDSLNKQIAELEAEREKYQPGYGYAVNRTLDKYYQPALDEFKEKHELPEDTLEIRTTLSFNCVPLTKDKIIQIAKDDNVQAISPFTGTADVHHFAQEEIPQYLPGFETT